MTLDVPRILVPSRRLVQPGRRPLLLPRRPLALPPRRPWTWLMGLPVARDHKPWADATTNKPIASDTGECCPWQLRKCSDNSLVNLWVKPADVANDPTAVVLIRGTCYKMETCPATFGAPVTSPEVVAGCDDPACSPCVCCKGDGFPPQFRITFVGVGICTDTCFTNGTVDWKASGASSLGSYILLPQAGVDMSGGNCFYSATVPEVTLYHTGLASDADGTCSHVSGADPTIITLIQSAAYPSGTTSCSAQGWWLTVSNGFVSAGQMIFSAFLPGDWTDCTASRTFTNTITDCGIDSMSGPHVCDGATFTVGQGGTAIVTPC